MSGSFSRLLYHIVFATKDRLPLITRPVEEELYAYLGGILRENEGTLIAIGGMPDHVHILACLRARHSVSTIVRLMKSNSSKWINSRHRNSKFGWQTGYGAFSVSQSQAPGIIRYIRNQKHHHGGRTFRDEFVHILHRHGVEFDDRFLPS
jgi:REP element-mobilizing transposase RayT